MSKARILETASDGIIILRIEKDDRNIERKKLIDYMAKSKQQMKKNGSPELLESDRLLIDFDWKIHKPKRSLTANNLHWALLTILAFEIYQENDPKWVNMLHEEILELYAPKVFAKLLNKEVPKRSSDMDVSEFNRLIEGDFYELASNGISVSNPQEIESYWNQWYTWRGKQEVDPLEKTYLGIDDYRRRVSMCEACKKYLGGEERGSIAHIISRGAGGCDEAWNILRLCDEHHTGIGGVEYDVIIFDKLIAQHKTGWQIFLDSFPHLAWKVNKALKHVSPQTHVENNLMEDEIFKIL
ncbi:MAG TPA: HNH endonuclease signature motif containing protein [Candidatus Nitrosocosmicus sp.]|nr:HNH endonuclease signature motif containing protein [Candidatus Nitrosocosmicus sp.]